MPRSLLLPLAAAALHAASIHGVVMENQTGHLLVRTVVTALPMPGTGGGPHATRTDLNGAFAIDNLVAGSYLVSAAHRGMAPAEYGQKRWNSAGLPVILEADQQAILELRLPFLGAITGKIMDENDVGLPDHEVLVYRNARPPVLEGRAPTDDRGIYRIFGLHPGSYLVRSATKLYEDGGYVPTFYKDSGDVDHARPVAVTINDDTPDVNIHATAGQLYPIAGIARALGLLPSTVVTLVSDTGSESVTTDERGVFRFQPQAPGKYELYAASGGMRNYGPYAGYMLLDLERSQTDLRLNLAELPTVIFSVVDAKGAPLDISKIEIMARRHDLSGAGKPEPLRLSDGRIQLPPGRWDFAVRSSATLYAAAYSGPSGESAVAHAEGWNSATISVANQTQAVKFVVANNSAGLHGTVKGRSGNPLSGVPVFLEPMDLDPTRRFNEVLSTRTDNHGQYQFAGLAPGRYRVLATYEFRLPGSADLEAAHAPLLLVEAGTDMSQDLELFVLQ